MLCQQLMKPDQTNIPAKSRQKSPAKLTPSFCSRLSRSRAGIFPHKYFCPPYGVTPMAGPSLLMNAGFRTSTSHDGLHVAFLNGDLQSTLCMLQCVCWQILLQYCVIIILTYGLITRISRIYEANQPEPRNSPCIYVGLVSNMKIPLNWRKEL